MNTLEKFKEELEAPSQNPWYALPTIALICFLTFYILSNIQIVLTPSVDATVVWPVADRPKRGDYVSFDLTNKVIPTADNTVKVTKLFQCTPGMWLERVENKWFCDGEYIGSSRTNAIDGTPLEQFYFAGDIPKGKAFVTGTHEFSFDSRYWGLVNVSELTTVKKVF